MQFKIFKKENIVHGISDASFGSMAGKGGEKKAERFLKSLGYDTNVRNLVWAEQVFGSKVHICKIKDSGKTIKRADGLITKNKNQVLAIVSADCLPILIYDPKKEVVAILHGSRESLIKGIIKNTISKLVSNFNSDPKEILVALGPHIRKCHYWLKEKTYQKLKKTKYKKYFINLRGVIKKPWLSYYARGRIYFDLTKLAFDELLKLGIRRKNIEDCGICTYCQSQKYFSARKMEENEKVAKKNIPVFASFIGLRGLKIVSTKNFKTAINKATEAIKRGEILICPTDTVYGLITDATNKKAVEKLFKIKKRAKRKPIPIFVKDLKMAKKLAFINKNQEKVLKKFWFSRPNFKKTSKDKIVEIAPKIWPGKGKVTAVLKRKKDFVLYGVGKKTIGLRIPNYKFILELLKKTNRPLTGTSANISGKPASTKIKEVLQQFRNQKFQPDLILDAGNLKKAKPSMVIDLTRAKPKILRK